MKTKHWIKIIVALKLDANGVAIVPVMVSQFKALFHVEHVYFARYENESSSTFEISAETGADWPKLKRWFRAQKGVAGVRIELRGTGSIAHALAYKAVAAMPSVDPKKPADDPLHDVVHWMCNMRGLDYMREVKFYGLSITHFANMLAEKGTDAMKALRARQLSDLARCRKRLPEESGPSRATPKSSAAGARKKRSA